MDRENFPEGEDRKLAGRTTREPIEPRYALTESADPVVKRGRLVPSVKLTEKKKQMDSPGSSGWHAGEAAPGNAGDLVRRGRWPRWLSIRVTEI